MSDRHRDLVNRKNARRKANKQCRRCAKPLDCHSVTYCRVHLEDARLQQRRHRERIKQDPLAYERHLELERHRLRRWRAKQRTS